MMKTGGQKALESGGVDVPSIVAMADVGVRLEEVERALSSQKRKREKPGNQMEGSHD
jgi:hypothetical protein